MASKYIFRLSSFFLLFGLYNFCVVGQSVAQTSAEVIGETPRSIVPLPEGIPPLPLPLENEAEFILSKKNVALFHEVLLAPMAAWLKEGRFFARLYRHEGVSWRYGSDWLAASQQNSRITALTEDGGLSLASGNLLQAGTPFGRAADIDRESDPIKKAQKIIWNSVYTEGMAGDVVYGVDMSWIGLQSVLRRSSGIFYKWLLPSPSNDLHPAVATADATDVVDTADEAQSADTSPQAESVAPSEVVFSGANDVSQYELLKLFSPPVAYGFAHLTKRFRGAKEDEVWIYSPVIGQSRHVLSSNRSDPLLGGVLTPDDIFIFSAKPQSVAVKVLDEKVLLVPVSTLSLDRAKPESVYRDLETAGDPSSLETNDDSFEDVLTVRGSYQRRDGVSVAMRWNYQNRRFPFGAAWIPTDVSFVPRRVWILEVSPRDPYYKDGRQVLVVDRDMMLPIYKIVSDRKGRLDRMVMTAWSLASTADGRTRFPYAAFVLAVDQGGKRAQAMTTRYVRTFLGKQSEAAISVRKFLDIKAHSSTAVPQTQDDAESAEAADRDF